MIVRLGRQREISALEKTKEINKRQGWGNVFLLCSILNIHVVFNFLCSCCYHVVHIKFCLCFVVTLVYLRTYIGACLSETCYFVCQ